MRRHLELQLNLKVQPLSEFHQEHNEFIEETYRFTKPKNGAWFCRKKRKDPKKKRIRRHSTRFEVHTRG